MEEDKHPLEMEQYEKKEGRLAQEMEDEALAREGIFGLRKHILSQQKRAAALDRAERYLAKRFGGEFMSDEMDDLTYYYYDDVLNDWYEQYCENPGPWKEEMKKLKSAMSKYFNKDGTLREEYANQRIRGEGWEIL